MLAPSRQSFMNIRECSIVFIHVHQLSLSFDRATERSSNRGVTTWPGTLLAEKTKPFPRSCSPWKTVALPGVVWACDKLLCAKMCQDVPRWSVEEICVTFLSAPVRSVFCAGTMWPRWSQAKASIAPCSRASPRPAAGTGMVPACIKLKAMVHGNGRTELYRKQDQCDADTK